jgi:hypothetical protein
VLKEKVRIEICEADPFIGCCGPGRASLKAAAELRNTLIERNETVKALREEFKGEIEIERQIISRRKGYNMYPPHIRKLLQAQTPLPFILVNGQLVSQGKFPSLEEFRQLIKDFIKRSAELISNC